MLPALPARLAYRQRGCGTRGRAVRLDRPSAAGRPKPPLRLPAASASAVTATTSADPSPATSAIVITVIATAPEILRTRFSDLV